MRPSVAHARRTSRPTRVALDWRLTGPTGGHTIGGCQYGGAAPRMAALCAAHGAAIHGAGRAACPAACHVARCAADPPPAAHRPNRRVTTPEPDLG